MERDGGKRRIDRLGHTAARDEASASGKATSRNDASRRLSLGELTDEAGVSVRTVRYYIAEGLLPPPEGAGPGSAYGAGHRDRLRLIQRMKAAYLPLREIRRRLAGLDDEAVRRLLREDAGEPGETLGKADWDPSLAGAREYLALMESREPYHTEPLPFAMPSPSAPAHVAPARSRPPRPTGVVAARRPPSPPEEPRVDTPLWHHIPLGDEAELVISERVYARHRDRVDWLVRWARKVFG